MIAKPKPYDTTTELTDVATLETISMKLDKITYILESFLELQTKKVEEVNTETIAEQMRRMMMFQYRLKTTMSQRTIDLLTKQKIVSFHDLLSCNIDELNRIKGFGCASRAEIHTALKWLNRNFNGDIYLGMFHK